MSEQDKSTAEIEREVAASRERLALTLDRIERKLSPGELIDDTVAYFRGSGAIEGAGDFGRNLAASVRDNPMPVALMAAGLGWMIWSGSRPVSGPSAASSTRFLPAPSSRGRLDGAGNAVGDAVDTAQDKVARLSSAGQDKLSRGMDTARDATLTAKKASADAIDGARESLSHARERILRGAANAREGLQDAGDRMQDSAANALDRIAEAGERAQRTYRAQLDERPLAVAAVAFAIGAALGAALPRTRQEDQWLGEHADALKNRVGEEVRTQAENVEAVAGAAYGAAREEAEKQDLSPEAGKEAGESVKQKVVRVGEAAVEASKREAQDRFSDAEDESAQEKSGNANPQTDGSGSTPRP